MVLIGYMELILIYIFLYAMIMIFSSTVSHMLKIIHPAALSPASIFNFVYYYNYTDDKRKWLVLFCLSFILIWLQYIIKHVIFMFCISRIFQN